MNNIPLVSIIIPAYNSEKYLEACLQSTISQSWPNKEIIIINDGSTDNTKLISQKYKHQGVLLIDQKNKGAAAARNNGLNYAKGSYIQFLDADDILSPNKIEVQVKALADKKNKVAVCSTVFFEENANHLDSKSSTYEDSFLHSTNIPIDFLVNLWGGNGNGGSMIQTNAWLTPIELIKKNKPWEEFYSPDDDGEYFCRIIMSSEGVIYTKNCYNYYRKYKNESLSSRTSYKALEGCFKSILYKKATLESHLNELNVRRAIANQLIEIAVQAYPRHKKLSKTIQLELKKLNTPYTIPIIGGKVINKLSLMLGWKMAKTLQFLFQHYIKPLKQISKE